MKLNRIIPLIIALCLVLAVWCQASEPSVKAELSSTNISLGDTVILIVTVEGSRSPEITVPNIDGLFINSRGTSTMINMVNGNFSSSTTARYSIEANAEGSYTIPPIQVTISGQTYQTTPLTLTVDAPSYSQTNKSSGNAVSSSPASANDAIAFLEVEALGEHYIGEVVPIVIHGFFNERYKTSLDSPPTLVGEGVMMAPIEEKPTQTRMQIKGENYTEVLWKTTLSGIKEGSNPLNVSMEASVYIRSQRSNDPFSDPFFDSFFSGEERKQLQLTTKPFSFTVLPLPQQGQPSNFSGAIGDFSISVSADPIIADLGEPITIRTVISGEGNFDRVHAPIFPESDEWKSYSPTIVKDANKNPRQKTFEQVVVAKKDSLEEIPALAFDYFNSKDKTYVTATSKPIAIHIRPGKTTPPAPLVVKPTTTSTPTSKAVTSLTPLGNEKEVTVNRYTNLLPQHLTSGRLLKDDMQPFFKTKLFRLLVILGLFVLVLATIFHFILYLRTKNPDIRKNKLLKRQLDNALMILKQHAENNQSHEYLTLCTHTIQDYLAQQWNMKPSAITASTVREKSSSYGLFVEILERADRASFAGDTLNTIEMNRYLSGLEEAFRQ